MATLRKSWFIYFLSAILVLWIVSLIIPSWE